MGRVCLGLWHQSRDRSYRSFSSSVKSTLDVLHRQPKDHRPAMRTRCGGRCRQQAIDKPLHFFGRELHVDLYNGLACEACGDIIPQRLLGYTSLVEVDVIKYLGKKIAGLALWEICRDGFDGNCSSRQFHDAESKRREIVLD